MKMSVPPSQREENNLCTYWCAERRSSSFRQKKDKGGLHSEQKDKSYGKANNMSVLYCVETPHMITIQLKILILVETTITHINV